MALDVVSQYLIRDADKLSYPPLNKLLTEKLPKATLGSWKEMLFTGLRLEDENAEGRIPLKPGILVERGVGRILNGFAVGDFLVVGFAAIGLAQISHPLGMFVDQNHVFVGMCLFFPLYASRCFSGFFGRWRRRSVPSMIKSVGTPGVTPLVANAEPSRSGICFKRTKLRSSSGRNR